MILRSWARTSQSIGVVGLDTIIKAQDYGWGSAHTLSLGAAAA